MARRVGLAQSADHHRLAAAVILRVITYNEPGIRGSDLQPINCWLLLCNYEGIDDPEHFRTLWEQYEEDNEPL